MENDINNDVDTRIAEAIGDVQKQWSKNRVALYLQNDEPKLVNTLDELKGSYAVEYVLSELLRKGNTHTLQSALELIKKNRK